MIFHLVDEVLEGIFEDAEAKDFFEVGNAVVLAIGAGGVGLFEGHGALFAGGGEFEGGELDAAVFAEGDVAFAGVATDGAGAGVAEIEEVMGQRAELHGRIVTSVKREDMKHEEIQSAHSHVSCIHVSCFCISRSFDP
jgi:hypothetical protein